MVASAKIVPTPVDSASTTAGSASTTVGSAAMVPPAPPSSLRLEGAGEEKVPSDLKVPAEEEYIPLELDAHGGLRGVLSVHIAVFHFLSETGWKGDLLGEASVTVFILLTGFTLAAVYGRKQGLAKKKFYRARLARVAPLYYVTQFGSIPLYYVMRPYSVPTTTVLTIRIIVNSLFLCVFDGGLFSKYTQPFNGPAWTICTFVAFWLSFPYVLPRAQKWTTEQLFSGFIKAYWLQAFVYISSYVVINDLAGSNFDCIQLAYAHPLTRFPVFLAGVAAGVWRSRLKPSDVVHWPKWFTWITPCKRFSNARRAGDGAAWAQLADSSAGLWFLAHVGVLVLSLFEIGDINTNNRSVLTRRDLFTPLSAFVQFTCLIALTLDTARESRLSAFCNRLDMQYLGKISMALYLCHVPIYRYSYPILGRRKGDMPISYIFIALSSAFFTAILLYHYLEEPARRYLTR